MEVFIVTTCIHLVRSVWNAQRLICHRFFPYQCTCSSNPLKPRDLSVLGCLIWNAPTAKRIVIVNQLMHSSSTFLQVWTSRLQGFKAYEVHITVQVWLQVANDQLMRKMWMHWIGRSLSCDHWNIPQKKKKLDICKFTLILRIPLFSLFYWLRDLFQVKGLCSSMGWEAVISKACLGL